MDATDRDSPVVKSEVELAWTVDQVIPTGDYLLQLANGSNWYFGEQGGPSIRVALQEDPDTALDRVVLPQIAYLSGVSLNGDKLYLLQTQAFQSANPKPVPEKPEEGDDEVGNEEKPTTEELKPNVFLTIIDLANLPELTVIAESALVDKNMGWSNQFKPTWPSAGKLLWSNAGGYRYWGWGGPWIDDVVGDSIWPGYYGASAGQLICFDVTNTTQPSLASSVNLSVEENEDGKVKYANRWNFSEAILNNNGLVYLSSQHTDFIEIEPEEEKPMPDPEPEDPDGPIEKPRPEPDPGPRGYWITSYELHVVDYTDMFHPVVRDATSIPGTLIGTSHDGALLYTQGVHWTVDHKWDGNWIDASSYDGLEAHLVDSIEQPQNWPRSHIVTDEGILYMTFSEAEKGEPTEGGEPNYVTTYYMQSLTLDETAKFTLLDEIELETGIQQLTEIGGHLFGQDNQRTLYLFDTLTPSSLSVSGRGTPKSCLWFNLGSVTDSIESEIWVPLGQYGAVKFDFDD